MYLSELINKDQKEISKISKEEIIKCIVGYKWQWQSNIESVKSAEKKLIEQSAAENATKRLLLGYLGEGMPQNDYGEAPLSEVNLLELVGKVLVKASRYE